LELTCVQIFKERVASAT